MKVQSPTERYRVLDPAYPHLITPVVRHKHRVLLHPAVVEILYGSLAFLQKEGLEIFSYVIMDNHMHLIMKFPELKRCIRRFKAFTGQAILEYLRNGDKELYDRFTTESGICQFWDRTNHPKIIYNSATMKQKVDYIHNNPVKRNLVSEPDEWEHSSIHGYNGDASRLEINTDW